LILDIIGVMRALDYVLGSPLLTPSEKRDIAEELKSSLPAKMLCSKAQRTHAITSGIIDRAIGIKDAEANSSPKEDCPQEQQLSPGSPRSNVIGRNDCQANGGSAKVERSKRKVSFSDAGTA
jgi:hypothetical protein